ncbi:hypothetical protein LCGC14_0569530 [marine sediment metagenome]|uniref:Uncharacterized protein n=1 Tax=marine sediment metagenome TaxID=412755 RepID=A0A0F9RPQ0_9ZZZZ
MDSTYISTRDAHALTVAAGIDPITFVTIRTWVHKYNLGKKIGGRLRIDKTKYMEFLHGDNEWKERAKNNQGSGVDPEQYPLRNW